MTVSFQLLRDALTNLALRPDEQREALAGSVVTDELALDLDNAVGSLEYEMDRTGIRFHAELLADLKRLNEAFAAPPADPLWDDASLDHHPTWTTARDTAARLLGGLPAPVASPDLGDTPKGARQPLHQRKHRQAGVHREPDDDHIAHRAEPGPLTQRDP